MKATKFWAILLVLALMLCLLPVTALADPAEETEPEETAEAAAPEDAEAAEEGEETEDAEPAEEGAETEDAETAGEAEPVEEAEEAGEPAAEGEVGPIINGEGEICYAAEGHTVYNNGGTVYNNGALVYNNGGLVYNNGGTVYNNGGIVYANGGTVYNNGGTVYNNSVLVYTFEDGVVESRIYGYYKVTLAADYSALAEIEGLTEEGYLAADGSCTVTPREGYLLTAAEADAGVLTEMEDGSFTLSQVDADLTLTLTFQAEAPAFDLEEGTYAEEQTLTITAPEGAEIYYTLDGSEPREDNSQLYEEPLVLSEGVTLTAVAIAEGAEPSKAAAADFAFVTVTAPEFEDTEEGEDPPKAAAFTVENPGSVNAVIESVSLEGEDAESFTLNTEKGATIKAGKTNEKTWTIRPASGLEKGTYTATVVFTLDGGETVELDVSFTVK